MWSDNQEKFVSVPIDNQLVEMNKTVDTMNLLLIRVVRLDRVAGTDRWFFWKVYTRHMAPHCNKPQPSSILTAIGICWLNRIFKNLLSWLNALTRMGPSMWLSTENKAAPCPPTIIGILGIAISVLALLLRLLSHRACLRSFWEIWQPILGWLELLCNSTNRKL